MAVAVDAPAVFRATGADRARAPLRGRAAPRRRHARSRPTTTPASSSRTRFIALHAAVAIPNGLTGVGYERGDITNLVEGALPQTAPARERAARDRRRRRSRPCSSARWSTGDRLPVHHAARPRALDGQRRLRSRQQRRLLRYFDSIGEPLPDPRRRPRHPRPRDRPRRRVAAASTTRRSPTPTSSSAACASTSSATRA